MYSNHMVKPHTQNNQCHHDLSILSIITKQETNVMPQTHIKYEI